jgi:hypothetical protein
MKMVTSEEVLLYLLLLKMWRLQLRLRKQSIVDTAAAYVTCKDS